MPDWGDREVVFKKGSGFLLRLSRVTNQMAEVLLTKMIPILYYSLDTIDTLNCKARQLVGI